MDDVTRPLLQALIGVRQVRLLREFGAGPADLPQRLQVNVDAAAPWIRVAVVDALDRWLQLPLDQSLVDAERGISRLRAAKSLKATASARSLVIADALLLARHASGGVIRYMRKLGSRRRAVPTGMLRAFESLAEGYRELREEVTGPDRQLSAVVDCWWAAAKRILTVDLTEADDLEMIGRRHQTPMVRPGSMIDPRQIRARVFALSVDPRAPEITMDDVLVEGDAAIRVRVPAYRRSVDEKVAPRLLVRLLDRVSANPGAASVLTIATSSAGRHRPYFEGVVPLRGMSAADLRADVFDLLSNVPPAATDTDEELQQVRRATVFLSEWRHLLADTQLAGAAAAPSARLRELARRLSPTEEEAHPLFAGGPSLADLDRLAGLPNEELASLALVPPPSSGGPFDLIAGHAQLLVAELAARVLDESYR